MGSMNFCEILRRWPGFAARGCVLLALAGTLQAAQVEVHRTTPAKDFWFYPYAIQYEGPTSPAFGSFGNPSFDNRDGQFFMSFLASPEITAGLGASNYSIVSARLTLTVSNDDTKYDGTYDFLSEYTSGVDTDGRPLELFGAAYRNGWTASTIQNTTQTAPGSPAKGTRSAYPTDFLNGTSLTTGTRDVSNSVTGGGGTPAGFDTNPFAIGKVANGDLTNGYIDPVSDVVFDLNLANPDVVRYLQESLNIGFLNFLATSLFSASYNGDGGGTGGETYFYDSTLSDFAPRLDIVVQVVPEPSALTMLLCGMGLFFACYRGARAGRKGSH